MGQAGEWDVIVVGSGLGGVSAAAILARSGLKVLVCEQSDGVGGLAHAFQRDGRTFDSAIRVLAEGEMVQGLLDWLGVADQCELTVIDHLYEARFPDRSVFAPTGLEEFMEAHIRLFPGEAEGIRAFFQLRRQMFLETAQAPMRVTDPSALGQLAELLPTLMKYRTATLQQVMDEYLRDPRLKAMCSALWPYMGAPPSQLSFFAYSQFIGVLIDGPSYCRGSFQKLVDAFVTAVRRGGGQVATGTPVERILLHPDGRVAGVRTAAGEVCTAPVVVSNADARHTFEELVGAEHLPGAYARRLRRLRPSMSACVVYAATTQDVLAQQPAHETFVYRHWDHEDTWRDLLAGRPGGMSLSIMTMLDPGLAPPGEHLLIATAVAPWRLPDGQSWHERKDAFADSLLGEFETVIPDLRKHLTFVQAGTPQTIQRYTRNHEGATYGWAMGPHQIGGKRLPHDTPVPGLFLSGHWTEEGPASFRVILSGMNTARQVLGHLGTGLDVPTFKPDDVPQLAL
ncbi:NAD(P)/FAD-dependent oxidoreductase [Streptomyces sp. B1866]|uniref:phytoene desaturase family protein n=1 Tax=Streptomyces sp. B1866 TaxID=3075431 RepID=UPI00289129CE|nr:NAD(P)/FAD-dependent oxidoreductase [Streptomyces sp. B1866]MDT3395892.1 NAD(P)/FAD-dependent oxidoreductase [Streptomyces sp. B1866]